MSFEVIQNILIEYWPLILRGAGVTLSIALISTIIGALIGFFIGVMHTIPKKKRSVKMVTMKLINTTLTIYMEIFRGTPMIVQAVVVFYGLAAYGIHLNTFIAGVIVVSLNTGAYMAEIVRGGIISIDKGQYEAAKVLGYNKIETFFIIILPQVVKIVLPSITNEVITLVKDTSLSFVLAIPEMFTIAKQIAAADASIIALLVAGVFYYVFNVIVAFVMGRLEKRLSYYV